MYPVSLAVDIDAPPARVWRALCDPAEVVRWDANVIEAIDAPADYPQPGQHVRWRCRAGPFHLLHDRPLEVEAPKRLRSHLALGPYRYEETYDITPAGRGCRLYVGVAVSVPLPVLHSFTELLYVGPQTKRAFEQSLGNIKRLCESEP
jgi:hypothetical protein